MGVFVFVCAESICTFNVCGDGDLVNGCVYMHSSVPVRIPAVCFLHVNIKA